jgi:hypothetical protein
MNNRFPHPHFSTFPHHDGYHSHQGGTPITPHQGPLKDTPFISHPPRPHTDGYHVEGASHTSDGYSAGASNAPADPAHHTGATAQLRQTHDGAVIATVTLPSTPRFPGDDPMVISWQGTLYVKMSGSSWSMPATYVAVVPTQAT